MILYDYFQVSLQINSEFFLFLKTLVADYLFTVKSCFSLAELKLPSGIGHTNVISKGALIQRNFMICGGFEFLVFFQKHCSFDSHHWNP